MKVKHQKNHPTEKHIVGPKTNAVVVRCLVATLVFIVMKGIGALLAIVLDQQSVFRTVIGLGVLIAAWAGLPIFRGRK